MDDVNTALSALRADPPEPSPLMLSRARVSLLERAAREQPGRSRGFGRGGRLSRGSRSGGGSRTGRSGPLRGPLVQIGVTLMVAGAAVAAVALGGGRGTSGTSDPSGRHVALSPARPSASPPTAATPRPTPTVDVDSAAWSVSTASDGTVHVNFKTGVGVTFRQPLQIVPTLKKAGVPAELRLHELCDPGDLAVQHRVIQVAAAEGDGWTISPAAMPPGSRIVIGYLTGERGSYGVSIGVQEAGKRALVCRRHM